MADVLKVLGQVCGNHDTFYTAYTVPTVAGSELAQRNSIQTLISTIVVCAVTGSAIKYSIQLIQSTDGGIGLKNLLFSSVALAANKTDVISAGFTMSAGDYIQVKADDASGTTNELGAFSIFGVETVG